MMELLGCSGVPSSHALCPLAWQGECVGLKAADLVALGWAIPEKQAALQLALDSGPPQRRPYSTSAGMDEGVWRSTGLATALQANLPLQKAISPPPAVGAGSAATATATAATVNLSPENQQPPMYHANTTSPSVGAAAADTCGVHFAGAGLLQEEDLVPPGRRGGGSAADAAHDGACACAIFGSCAARCCTA